MNYRDMLVTCAECGKQYVFTVEAQRQMAERGQEVKAPKVCKACVGKVDYGDRLHGRIKWFSLEKGYGFIAADDGGEIFVHRTGISLTVEGNLPSLEEGQEVLYDAADSPKGPHAIGVQPYTG